ncbi:MAG TPA: hypothetical protein DCF84_02380 [Bacteroidetes bacterium]|nr:hypothetical protein [Bacteroidota bacterium]|tara:strand:- start:307 stop:624 length:318 start_codon:yes stop_codon:yes gene_type:complete
MAIGFPAKYSTRCNHSFKAYGAFSKAMKNALETKGWKLLKEDEDRHQIIAQIPASGSMTLGELCKIQFDMTSYVIESRCILFTQFVDFGKNKKNVKSLLSMINSN